MCAQHAINSGAVDALIVKNSTSDISTIFYWTDRLFVVVRRVHRMQVEGVYICKSLLF